MTSPAIVRQTLQHGRPLIRRVLTHDRMAAESLKGCGREFSPTPVPLTPPLDEALCAAGASNLFGNAFPPVMPGITQTNQPGPRVWFNLAVHPDYPSRPQDCESLIRLLSGAANGWVLEVAGNCDHIDIRIGLDKSDVSTLIVAFLHLHLPLSEGRRDENRFPETMPAVMELVPSPPYADAFTRLDELPKRPVSLIVEILNGLPAGQVGLYQVCATPVKDYRWLAVAQSLHDARFRCGLEPATPDGTPTLNWTQQMPSGNLMRLTQETYTKTHPDRAYYFAQCRFALWSSIQGVDGDTRPPSGIRDEVVAQLKCLATPLGLIRQAGRPMDVIPPDYIASAIEPEQIVTMLERGWVHRHGVLVNSEELAAWAQLPLLREIEALRLDNLRCEPLALDQPAIHGTRLGTCMNAEQKTQICVHPKDRCRHTCVIGRNGVGKSTLLQSMCLDDIARGEGVLMIDPHGQLVKDMADRIPAEALERTHWLEFEDLQHAVLFNPLRAGGRDQPPERVADHFIGAFKTVTDGWGDRLEHILRHLIIAAVQLPEGCLLDVLLALERDTDRGKRVRNRMIESCADPMVQNFLVQFGKRYKDADINPVQHKLSKLLMSGGASLSLRQPENRLDVPGWMERGDIVLVDLGTISGDFKHLIGSFLIAAAYSAALSRRGNLRPFHIFADEAHRFSEELLAGIIAETRKFKVGLTAAFQYLKQFSPKTVHALGTVGTYIVFNVDSGDADLLAKSFRSRVSAEQITALNDFEAYARIGIEPVHLHTPHFRDLPEGPRQFEQIRAGSIKHWYVSRRQLKARIDTLLRGGGGDRPPQINFDPEPVERLPDAPDWPN